MTDARTAILTGIREAMDRAKPTDEATTEALKIRLASRPRGPIPQRAASECDARIELFVQMAEKASASVQRIAAWDDLPKAVADYLTGKNLPASLRMAPHPELEGANWESQPTLDMSRGAARSDDAVGLSRAAVGVAETGTLMLASGPASPPTLNFMPETHIVVLKRSEIVGGYEDGWDIIRDRFTRDGRLPRTVNMITGPSRTGDIEQTIELGAHGPLRVHIVIVDD